MEVFVAVALVPVAVVLLSVRVAAALAPVAVVGIVVTLRRSRACYGADPSFLVVGAGGVGIGVWWRGRRMLGCANGAFPNTPGRSIGGTNVNRACVKE